MCGLVTRWLLRWDGLADVLYWPIVRHSSSSMQDLAHTAVAGRKSQTSQVSRGQARSLTKLFQDDECSFKGQLFGLPNRACTWSSVRMMPSCATLADSALSRC